MFKNKKEEYEQQQDVFKQMAKDGIRRIDTTKLGIDLSKLNIPGYKDGKYVKPKTSKKKISSDKTFISASDIIDLNIEKIPKLLDPLLQKTGLAALVGTSDIGKSTILRQLSIQLALNIDNFLDYPLNGSSHKVIYVATEDDISSISFGIKKQVNYLQHQYPELDIKNLERLSFIFDTDNLLKVLKKKLQKDPTDLIIIDAFTDVFTGEINSNTQVRSYLNSFDKLAKKNNCLILFLHHIGKRTQKNKPSKDNIIGSQGFEAKMRAVLELRSARNRNERELWVLKSNFLDTKFKDTGVILSFNENLIFENTSGKTVSKSTSKKNDPNIVARVMELSAQGLTIRKIEETLKGTNLAVSKSVIGEILKSK